MPCRVEIQCECAFTYMNAVFRKNLTDAFSVDAIAVDTAFGTGRRTRRWHDRARFCRTTVTCIRGVSDHLGAGRRAKKGAAKWGSLTPHWSLCSAATAAPTRERRHRAQPAANGKPQTRKEIERP